MQRTQAVRLVAATAVLVLVVVACSGDDEPERASEGPGSSEASDGAPLDLEAIGLWDDGPCDEALEPLVVGNQVTFASPVLTAEDVALALEASAEAFNGRGGANGHCIEVVTCDEGGTPEGGLECARSQEEAGIAVSINDSTLTPGPEVSEAFAEAGIARFAVASGQPDLTDPNSFPIDAGGIGTTMVAPQALVDEGVKKIASIRVDLPAASALIGIYEDIYGDEGVEFVADLPVPAGTTDFSQFILRAEQAGAEGVMIALGGQEAIQVLGAAQQVGSDVLVSASLGTFPYADLVELGDFAEQIILNGSTPPATADVPAMEVLRRDMAASGRDELQPQNIKATPVRSWLGLYALLSILRTAKTEDFSRENLTSLIKASGPIDMLGLTEDWTPDTDNPGIFPRTGNGYYAFFRWDPEAEFEGTDGNFVESSEIDFNELVCGSPVGAPEADC